MYMLAAIGNSYNRPEAIYFQLPPGVKNDNHRALFMCINICMMAAIGMAQEPTPLIKEAFLAAPWCLK